MLKFSLITVMVYTGTDLCVLIWLGNTIRFNKVIILHIQSKLFWFLVDKRRKCNCVSFWSSVALSQGRRVPNESPVTCCHSVIMPSTSGTSPRITNLQTRNVASHLTAQLWKPVLLPQMAELPPAHITSKVVFACLFSDRRGTRILFAHLSVTQTTWGKRGG